MSGMLFLCALDQLYPGLCLHRCRCWPDSGSFLGEEFVPGNCQYNPAYLRRVWNSHCRGRTFYGKDGEGYGYPESGMALYRILCSKDRYN